MKNKQFNTRPTDRTRAQLADLAARANSTLTGSQAAAIDAAWRAVFEIGFNQACTALGITSEREPFHAYWAKIREDECQDYTVVMWETIYNCFEEQRDAGDELATQRRALR